MSKRTHYLCIGRFPSAPDNEERPSPAEMEKMYAKFMAWKEKYQDQIVDMGGQLQGAGKIVSRDEVRDGPFAESKELIGGFMIISADSMDDAVKVVQEGPGIGMPGSSIEVREIKTP
ncbi:MAG: YciI family protein [Myxococcota bacterium]